MPKISHRFSSKLPKFAGIGCIAIGVYSLYESVISPMFWRFDLPDWLYFSLNRIPSLVVAFAVIGLGVFLLKRGKAGKDAQEFVEYQEGNHE